MSSEQPDGYYKRLNATSLFSNQHNGSIVSLVGRIITHDGSRISLESGEGGKVEIKVEPDFPHKPGDVIEAIGLAESGGTIQLFVPRDLGKDFDLQVYDEMITKIQNNPKYSQYFEVST